MPIMGSYICLLQGHLYVNCWPLHAYYGVIYMPIIGSSICYLLSSTCLLWGHICAYYSVIYMLTVGLYIPIMVSSICWYEGIYCEVIYMSAMGHKMSTMRLFICPLWGHLHDYYSIIYMLMWVHLQWGHLCVYDWASRCLLWGYLYFHYGVIYM